MQEQVNKSLHPLMWIAGIAVILLSAAGIAAIMGWIPSSKSVGDNATLTKADNPAEFSEKSEAKPKVKPEAKTVTTTASKPKTRIAQQHVANATPSKPVCAECGVIESTREVTQRGESTGVGVVGGAVVGGLLGNQIGGGHGKDAATVLGAVGGAVVGNEVEHRMKSTKVYEITVRFEDGSSTVIKETTLTGWRPGDRVKVVNGAIRSNN